MRDWEEGGRFSFDDSDRFEEDSLCSWSSEPESLCNNWRGWKKPAINSGSFNFGNGRKNSDELATVLPLTELAAKCVASHIPFELVEHVYPPVPEQLQLRIAFWSFPDNEEDIRLYSCLANGSADEFLRGEHIFKTRGVKDPLQIGFHLSATVVQSMGSRSTQNVAVTFDRRRISSCNCTCSSTAYWCSHVVAVCLHRIHQPYQVCLRAPVSESLSRLHREQLQKFAQYLISELPQQILPTAQRLLDELLGSQPSAINSVCGAPDPTAGASANDQTSWYLDEKALHDNIKKILIKFCVPAPIVFSDVNYLSTTAPPAAAEWTSLLRPLRGREPEGMWNLLSIVREMFKRNDRNAVPLLEIITEECMACEQILVWWFNTKVALLNGSSGHGGGGGGKHSNVNSNSHASQHACSSLCDEIVILWRLAALNPGLAPEERDMLHNQFTNWHIKIMEKVTKSRLGTVGTSGHQNGNKATGHRLDMEVFTGFKPAIEACYLDWEDYPMPGITYTNDINPMYHCPFTCFRHTSDSRVDNQVTQVNSSQAVLNCEHPGTHHHTHHHHHYHHHHAHAHAHAHAAPASRINYAEFVRLNMPGGFAANEALAAIRDGNRSSVSSEGFCESDDDSNLLAAGVARINVNMNMNMNMNMNINMNLNNINRSVDSDSQEGGGSDSSSNSSASSTNRNENITSRTDENEQSTSAKQPSSVVAAVAAAATSASHVVVVVEDDATKAKCSRRPSKDDSLSSSNSDSPQSGDEYNLYFYDSKAIASLEQAEQKEAKVQQDAANNKKPVFGNLKKCEDPWDILFARAEGLHAHGHGREACMLGVKLAEELLANPPDLMIDIPPIPRRKGKKQQLNPASHQLSCLASATLAKCAFLCTVLAENLEYSHLAFRVGMFGLEMARPPASTKPLEVKLANQETDLVMLLKRIPLGPQEIKILREKAEQLKEGTLKSRGEALLPIMLANFIFDALVMPSVVGRELRSKVVNMAYRSPSDEALAFEAAVAALGLKANVSEADHPLLCEGTRRQRGDLAIVLLVFYKDDSWKVARIMDRLLDREVHQLLKSPLINSYYTSNPPIKSQLNNMRREECTEQIISPLSSLVPPAEILVADYSKYGAGSRPHSSTSAEVDQGLAGMPMPNSSSGSGSSGALPTQNVPVQVTTRTKESRYKGKRAYPSIPNQPSEAGAHFMFELAKTVLVKAGGNSSTSLFTQASTSQNHHGPHRALHMCAFQLGLYALGLHNCVSPNWLSRTYSSHVSWITGQAMEIGASAISFLIDTWEGHLTPPEATSIADRASRGCDPNMVRAAAELALSCLPHAHALNPNEITRAIHQCKEQSDVMLEHSCLTVENAAKGGGVYPEVLFQVAKYWYELYVRHTPGGEHIMSMENDMPHDNNLMDPHGALGALIDPNSGMELPQQANGANAVMGSTGPVVVTTAPPPPPPPYQQHQHPTVTTLAPLSMSVPYAVAPYSFTVQGIHPHHAHPHMSYGGPIHPHAVQLPPPQHVQMYPLQFQYPPQSSSQPFSGNMPTTGAPGPYTNPNGQYPHPAAPPTYTNMPPNAPPPQMQPNIQYYSIRTGPVPNGHMFPMAMPPNSGSPMVPSQAPVPNIRPQNHRQPQQFSQTQLRYLLAAYRVGMLALETLARRVHDDRPQAKYARNPPYGEDVKWLLRISKHLGTQYLHQFCVCAVNSIVSPFVLHDVAIEAAHYLSRNNPGLVMQHLRTALTPLVQKCQQMYIQCMHQKLYHLTTADYEDFVNIVCAARAAFQITPEGNTQFKEWLQSIRRSKSCKKDLWTQINAALQANSK